MRAESGTRGESSARTREDLAGAMAGVSAAGPTAGKEEHTGLDPLYLAMNRFNRLKYDECVSMCTELLNNNPYDQAVRGARPHSA